MTRDRVAGLLWGDRNDERARHNVRQTLSSIRSACGPVVVTGRDHLGLDHERCKVDVVEFRRLVNATDRESLSRCLEFFGGDLLEGQTPREEAFESWLLEARDLLRYEACDVMDRLVEQLVAQECFDDAVAALTRRLAIDPACEPAHRRLMEVYARTGRRSEALRQFDACVRYLERELGVAPDAETNVLYEAIRQSGAH